jgi:hypothetical protein
MALRFPDAKVERKRITQMDLSELRVLRVRAKESRRLYEEKRKRIRSMIGSGADIEEGPAFVYMRERMEVGYI